MRGFQIKPICRFSHSHDGAFVSTAAHGVLYGEQPSTGISMGCLSQSLWELFLISSTTPRTVPSWVSLGKKKTLTNKKCL
jgi:hypothetical protein